MSYYDNACFIKIIQTKGTVNYYVFLLRVSEHTVIPRSIIFPPDVFYKTRIFAYTRLCTNSRFRYFPKYLRYTYVCVLCNTAAILRARDDDKLIKEPKMSLALVISAIRRRRVSDFNGFKCVCYILRL